MEVLQIVQILEKRNFDHDEAIQLAEAINGKSGLATKEDIGALKEDIVKLKNDINWLKGIGFLIVALLIKIAFF